MTCCCWLETELAVGVGFPLLDDHLQVHIVVSCQWRVNKKTQQHVNDNQNTVRMSVYTKNQTVL